MRTGKRTGGVALGVLAVSAVAACGATPQYVPAAKAGTLHGHILGIGGPPPGGRHVLEGTVVISDGVRVVARPVATARGYQVTLRPGGYTLTVDGMATCQPVHVVVPTSSDQSVDLTCQIR